MNRYERIFGAGPRGILISLVLLAIAWQLEPLTGLPTITDSYHTRWTVFAMALIATIFLALWSLTSLPPGSRGKLLVTTGAYRYFRHPLYASLVTFFHFGLAVLLNNWIYVIWAVLAHGAGHWNIRSEERLMREEFASEYIEYSRVTGRFVPRIWSVKQDRSVPPTR